MEFKKIPMGIQENLPTFSNIYNFAFLKVFSYVMHHKRIFFIDQCTSVGTVQIPPKGDFLVNGN